MNSLLTFLGRDAGFGINNNSAYTIINNNFILIDCGYTVFNILKEKLNFSKFDTINVIITHLHNDHAGSLSQLILYLWFVYGKKVNILSNCKYIKDYLVITGAPSESYELNPVFDGLTFIPTTHVKHIDSYGFKLSIYNKNIVYTRRYQYIRAISTLFK